MTTPEAPEEQTKPIDPIDAFCELPVKRDFRYAIMLMLWQRRFENPSFTIEVHPEDLKTFTDCVKYLEVAPQIKIFRPGGVPARGEIAATRGRSAIPARDAIPPKPYAVIQMVDQDGNAIVPVPNSEEEAKRKAEADEVRRLREGARHLAGVLSADLSQATFSTATIQEAIKTLMSFART